MNADKKSTQKNERFGNKEAKQKNVGKNKPGMQSGSKSNQPHSNYSRDI